MVMGISALAEDTKIAGDYTVQTWIELRKQLLGDSPQKEDWEKAFKIFKKRVESRFLDPIDKIIQDKEKKGEGFAAAALQCVLIEFLQALFEGKIYRPPLSKAEVEKRSELSGIPDTAKIRNHCEPNEYAKSKDLFVDFLVTHEPFKNDFPTNRILANKVFTTIRCGLLHEAATKEDSKIRAENGEFLIEETSEGVIFYRNKFQSSLKEFLENYKSRLLQDDLLKENFIRKMDDICQIKRKYYFAYGSNMDKSQLRKRINYWYYWTKGYIKDYEFTYNKKGKDGAKANLHKKEGGKVFGICYEIDENGLAILQEKYEKGYDLLDVCVKVKSTYIFAQTFISTEITEDKPTREYVDLVVKGANDFFSEEEEYINRFLKFKTEDE